MSRLPFFALAFVLCATCAFADANDMPDLPANDNVAGPFMVGNFSITGPCTSQNYCSYNLGNDGRPASGFGNFDANFSGTAEVTYNFYTGLPLTWTDTGYSYSATFGLGGIFQMSLPDGLTFMGKVTSGTAGGEGLTSEVQVNYAGQWSNGQYASGSVDEHELGFGDYQSLTETTALGVAQASTPEPSSILLFATGMFGAWRWKRKLRC